VGGHVFPARAEACVDSRQKRAGLTLDFFLLHHRVVPALTRADYCMTQIPEKTPEERLREKLEAFPEDFQQLVMAHQSAPTPATLARIVTGVMQHHGGDVFISKFEEKADGVLLVEDLGFDSLTLVEISFHAEEFLGYIIQIEDFAQIKTLGDLQGFLRKKIFSESVPAA
jgi:acyl carrier protein